MMELRGSFKLALYKCKGCGGCNFEEITGYMDTQFLTLFQCTICKRVVSSEEDIVWENKIQLKNITKQTKIKFI